MKQDKTFVAPESFINENIRSLLELIFDEDFIPFESSPKQKGKLLTHSIEGMLRSDNLGYEVSFTSKPYFEGFVVISDVNISRCEKYDHEIPALNVDNLRDFLNESIGYYKDTYGEHTARELCQRIADKFCILL